MKWILYLLSILPGYFFKALGGFLIIRFLDKFVGWYLNPANAIPGPRAGFFLGVFPQIQKEPFLEPAKRWWQQAGVETRLLKYSTILGRISVIVLDKELVKVILNSPAGRKNCRFNKGYDYLKLVAGDGLVTLEGEHWHRHRRIIQPAFSSSLIKDFLNKIVPDKVNQLVEYWKQAQGREIHVYSHMSAITLDIIGQVAFNYSFQGMGEIEKWAKDESSDTVAEVDDPLISAIADALKVNPTTAVFLGLGIYWMDAYVNPKVMRFTKAINKAVDDIIIRAKKSAEKDKSLLQLLLDASDTDPSATVRSLNDVELRDEVKTFVLAGHETTSTWCYWTLYALSMFPDVQDKVYADIVKNIKSSDQRITLEMVEQMEYFDAFLQEVLRMYPPVGSVVRHTARTEQLDSYIIPPRTRIVIPILLLHRHPLYWDDPDSFKPERWLNRTQEFDDRVSSAFLPFSVGGRNCIGKSFATIEAKLILAPLIRAFRFQVAPSQRDTAFTFTSFITMKSKPSLKILAVNR
jgi:cytochrome P450